MATVKDPAFERMLGIMVEAYAGASDYIDVPALEATARALVEHGGGADHYVHITPDGEYAIQHPLTERFTASERPLLECHFNHGLIWMQMIANVRQVGRYRIWLSEEQSMFEKDQMVPVWKWEKVD